MANRSRHWRMVQYMIRKEQVEETAQNQMFYHYLHNLFFGTEKKTTFQSADVARILVCSL